MSVPGSNLVGLSRLYQGTKVANVCPRVYTGETDCLYQGIVKQQISVPGSTLVELTVCTRAMENSPLSVPGGGINRMMSSIGGVSLFNGNSPICIFL